MPTDSSSVHGMPDDIIRRLSKAGVFRAVQPLARQSAVYCRACAATLPPCVPIAELSSDFWVSQYFLCPRTNPGTAGLWHNNILKSLNVL